MLVAGPFAEWRSQMLAALRGERASDVPCGTCSACCTSAQFVHIDPDEDDTLARIPRDLLARAPGLPRGHMILGYDERGHCPMLREGRCSIYDHRPRACRMYDCRVFAAAGIEPVDKPAIAEQARRWEFTYPTANDRAEHDAVLHAAAALARSGDTPTATALAVRAVVEGGSFS